MDTMSLILIGTLVILIKGNQSSDAKNGGSQTLVKTIPTRKAELPDMHLSGHTHTASWAQGSCHCSTHCQNLLWCRHPKLPSDDVLALPPSGRTCCLHPCPHPFILLPREASAAENTPLLKPFGVWVTTIAAHLKSISLSGIVSSHFCSTTPGPLILCLHLC